MFSIDFLHKVRESEMFVFERYLEKSSKILEVGGGTGFQAMKLHEKGYDITCIDIPRSNYIEERVFPVVDYDGRHIPFEDNSFDIIISSNVLEHVPDLPALHKEMLRVLKPVGHSLHAMPTTVWRFWSSITHYINVILKVFSMLFRKNSKGEKVETYKNKSGTKPNMWRKILFCLFPPRLGEIGTAFTELVTFSKYYRLKQLRKNNYIIEDVKPMGLFYTGEMILGEKLSMAKRRTIAKVLGSVCVLYKLRSRQ